MKDLNIKPIENSVPEGFFEMQRQTLLRIPEYEDARRKRLRATFFSTAAALLIGTFAILYPILSSGSISAEENLELYYTNLSDQSLQQSVDLADLDPFLEVN